MVFFSVFHAQENPPILGLSFQSLIEPKLTFVAPQVSLVKRICNLLHILQLSGSLENDTAMKMPLSKMFRQSYGPVNSISQLTR